MPHATWIADGGDGEIIEAGTIFKPGNTKIIESTGGSSSSWVYYREEYDGATSSWETTRDVLAVGSYDTAITPGAGACVQVWTAIHGDEGHISLNGSSNFKKLAGVLNIAFIRESFDITTLSTRADVEALTQDIFQVALDGEREFGSEGTIDANIGGFNWWTIDSDSIELMYLLETSSTVYGYAAYFAPSFEQDATPSDGDNRQMDFYAGSSAGDPEPEFYATVLDPTAISR